MLNSFGKKNYCACRTILKTLIIAHVHSRLNILGTIVMFIYNTYVMWTVYIAHTLYYYKYKHALCNAEIEFLKKTALQKFPVRNIAKLLIVSNKWTVLNDEQTWNILFSVCAYVKRNKDTLLAQLFTGIAEEPTGKWGGGWGGGGLFVSTVLMPKERDPLHLFGHQAYGTFFVYEYTVVNSFKLRWKISAKHRRRRSRQKKSVVS